MQTVQTVQDKFVKLYIITSTDRYTSKTLLDLYLVYNSLQYLLLLKFKGYC